MTTKYRGIGQDEPLELRIDVGNTDVKAMVAYRFGEEIYFPQYVRRPPANEYKQLAEEYAHSQMQRTAVFKMLGQGYVVGEHAALAGSNSENAFGVDKYRVEQIGACVVAALLLLYPQSHLDVQMDITYPVGTTLEQKKLLQAAVKRRFEITLADSKTQLTYNVTKVGAIAEPVAAFYNFVLTTEGLEYKRGAYTLLQPGMTFAVIDIGGGISSISPGIVAENGRVEPVPTNAKPIEQGIRNVMEALSNELRTTVPKLKKNTSIAPKKLRDAIKDRKVSFFGGEPIDCGVMVDNALVVLMRPLERQVALDFKYLSDTDMVVVSGGGGGVTYNDVRDTIKDHENVHPADTDYDRMRFGTVRGIAKSKLRVLKGKALRDQLREMMEQENYAE